MLGNNFFLKKSKPRHSLSLLLILIILVLFSCGFSSCGFYPIDIRDATYYEGIEGLELDFLEQAPPDDIYEDTPFNINFLIENKGASDVIGELHGILSLSFDPLYVDASELQGTANVDITNNGIVVRGIQLPGKSRRYTSGTEMIASFSNFRTKTIKGQREQPSTQIFASLCYPYTTYFAGLVCVDFNILGVNLREQVCYQQDIALDDQGAPLAVTLVEVENQPAGADSLGNPVVRPVFTIHVMNKGSGSVLTPSRNFVELDRVCTFQNLYREDFNTVEVRAILSASTELLCTPNPLRLFEGVGFTRCTVQENSLIPSSANYEAMLSVNLSYIYLTSASREVEIKRMNIYGDLTKPPDDLLPHEVEYQGRPINRCDYCALYNPNDPVCQPANAKYHIQFQEGFRCQCGFKSCERLYPKGLCVPFSDTPFCPGDSYCCMPECRSSEARIKGECYPKCSECSEAREDCACGTEELDYAVVAKGAYCCPDTKAPYPDEDQCDAVCNPPEEESSPE